MQNKHTHGLGGSLADGADLLQGVGDDAALAQDACVDLQVHVREPHRRLSLSRSLARGSPDRRYALYVLMFMFLF